jgi:sulfite exporter TauE/SafE
MINMFSLSALLIGFLGSFHCVAMCGPIALALSGGGEDNRRFLVNRSFYNLGRIVTYGILGLLAGLAGQTLLMAGFQKSISIGIGVLMVVSVILLYYMPGLPRTGSMLSGLNRFIKKIFAGVVKRKSAASLFTAGLANGILPCGFVYLAMAGAAATQNGANGAFYMILFGLGTFPAMLAVAAFGKMAGNRARLLLNRAAPVLMIILGLVFIYRGYSMKDNTCCGSKQSVTVEGNFQQ